LSAMTSHMHSQIDSSNTAPTPSFGYFTFDCPREWRSSIEISESEEKLSFVVALKQSDADSSQSLSRFDRYVQENFLEKCEIQVIDSKRKKWQYVELRLLTPLSDRQKAYFQPNVLKQLFLNYPIKKNSFIDRSSEWSSGTLFVYLLAQI